MGENTETHKRAEW